MIACDCAVCRSVNPKDKRLRSSILIQSATTTIVVDAGPDFRQQMLTHNVKKLDAVLLTHLHKDHIGGLDDVRAFNYFQKKPMKIYGSAATLSRVKKEFDYAFAHVKYAGVPEMDLCIIDEQSKFTVGDIPVDTILVWHMYMAVFGFRFGDFTYITDANKIDKPSLEKVKGSKILVLNALRKQKHVSHFTLEEAIIMADELQIPEVYFIHLSHQMGLHDEVIMELPHNIQLAYDGLKINIT